MMFLLALDAARFPQVFRSHIKCSFHKFENSSQFQQLSKKYIHARIFLELITLWARCKITDWNISLSQSSTSELLHRWDPHKGFQQIFFRISGWYDVALCWHTYELSTYLSPYHPLWFRHPNYFLDFGAPNHGIPQRVCSCLLGGGHPGGLPRTLGGRHILHQRGGVAEARPGRLRCLPGVSVTSMNGCWVVAWRHLFLSFSVGLVLASEISKCFR